VEDFDSAGESKGEWPAELGTEEEFVAVRRRCARFWETAVDIFACRLFNWATARRRKMQIARTDEQCKGRGNIIKAPGKIVGKLIWLALVCRILGSDGAGVPR
jgi:hypothetical protein